MSHYYDCYYHDDDDDDYNYDCKCNYNYNYDDDDDDDDLLHLRSLPPTTYLLCAQHTNRTTSLVCVVLLVHRALYIGLIPLITAAPKYSQWYLASKPDLHLPSYLPSSLVTRTNLHRPTPICLNPPTPTCNDLHLPAPTSTYITPSTTYQKEQSTHIKQHRTFVCFAFFSRRAFVSFVAILP